MANRPTHSIVISAGLWRGFDVAVEPPTTSHALQHFKTYEEAITAAIALSKAEGWRVVTCIPGAAILGCQGGAS